MQSYHAYESRYKIVRADYAGDFKIDLEFADGLKGVLDINTVLDPQWNKQYYQNREEFAAFRLDKDRSGIYWGKRGIDPSVLHAGLKATLRPKPDMDEIANTTHRLSEALNVRVIAPAAESFAPYNAVQGPAFVIICPTPVGAHKAHGVLKRIFLEEGVPENAVSLIVGEAESAYGSAYMRGIKIKAEALENPKVVRAILADKDELALAIRHVDVEESIKERRAMDAPALVSQINSALGRDIATRVMNLQGNISLSLPDKVSAEKIAVLIGAKGGAALNPSCKGSLCLFFRKICPWMK